MCELTCARARTLGSPFSFFFLVYSLKRVDIVVVLFSCRCIGGILAVLSWTGRWLTLSHKFNESREMSLPKRQRRRRNISPCQHFSDLAQGLQAANGVLRRESRRHPHCDQDVA